MSIPRVKTRCFAIALAPIVIFWMHDVISGQLFSKDLNVPVEILQDGRHWMESAGRFRFLSATWFFAALTVLAVALVIRDLAAPMARATRAAATLTMGVILMLALTATVKQHADPDGPRIYHRLGEDVFETALSYGNLPGCNQPEDWWFLGQCGENPVLSLFNRVMDIINGLAGLGVGALIVGMILCLQTQETRNAEEEAALLAQNLTRMRRQLYLSSLILTFGMFFATSWMYWPLPLVTGAERDAYGALILASALFTGTYFCLLILSFYIPVALVLDARVRALTRSTDLGSDADPDEWAAARGLKGGTSDLLRTGFAVTAPILAAFAGGISPISL